MIHFNAQFFFVIRFKHTKFAEIIRGTIYENYIAIQLARQLECKKRILALKVKERKTREQVATKYTRIALKFDHPNIFHLFLYFFFLFRLDFVLIGIFACRRYFSK